MAKASTLSFPAMRNAHCNVLPLVCALTLTNFILPLCTLATWRQGSHKSGVSKYGVPRISGNYHIPLGQIFMATFYIQCSGTESPRERGNPLGAVFTGNPCTIHWNLQRGISSEAFFGAVFTGNSLENPGLPRSSGISRLKHFFIGSPSMKQRNQGNNPGKPRCQQGTVVVVVVSVST